jgi:aminoglycoside phosphotransferase (APT) family kinase protein
MSEAPATCTSPVLDPDWLASRLSRYLWRDDETPGTVARVQIRLSRQTDDAVTALYHVGLERPDGGAIEQMYTGYHVPAERLDATAQSLAKKATRLPAVGRPLVVIPEGSLVLLAFPNDRRLSLLGSEELTAWLSERVKVLVNGSANGTTWRVADAGVTVLRYVPEKRLTMRCRARVENDHGEAHELAFIAKQFRNEARAATVYGNLEAFGNGPTAALVRVPRALAFDGPRGLVLMEDLPGQELKRALPSIDAERALRNLGRLMALFHKSPARVPATVSTRGELVDVIEAAQTIADAIPVMRPRLRACISKLRSLRGNDRDPAVLLHGACRLKHVFIHQGRLALVDLDGLAVGPAAYDLGNFLSSLYYLEEQERFDAPERLSYSRSFLSGYAVTTSQRIRPSTVMWFLAAILIHKQAGKYVTHLHEDRDHKVDRMITLAEAALARCEEVSPDLPVAAMWRLLPS